ncbi:DNA/RNA non-specific endonuclease [Teredinibacter turnerae]|uniref:DNA/RNA non-specific endonuclease n=1 Tax=Teredinibacter turnerae TaxID=2426 RepID=UPI00037C0876|nr:DNA/RNA non-specific endonuclease [Teredinibacter turnerae]
MVGKENKKDIQTIDSLNTPDADKIYIVNGRHFYETDGLGRTTKVQAELEPSPNARSCYQQGLAANCGATTDDGGHLIGAQFQGVGAQINLVPQDWELNRGAGSPWRAMEESWANAKADGLKVEIEMDVIYTDNGLRPEQFVVKWKIEGIPDQETFFNQAGG